MDDPVSRIAALQARIAELEARAAEGDQIRDQLALSEERFRLAFRTSPDAISITRVDDGTFVDVNDGFTRNLGFTREEAMGKSSVSLGIWAEDGSRDEMVRILRSQGRVENFETRYRKKDGTLIESLFSAEPLLLDGVPHLLSVGRNIDDLRKSQKLLRESEARFKTLFEHAPDAITLQATDGRYLEVNKTGCDWLGYTRDEFLHMDSLAVLTATSLDTARAAFAETLQGGSPVFESRLLRRDGSELPVETGMQRIEFLGATAVLSVSRDLSERKRLESQLVSAQRMEAVARLASGVAHDFNNLLTVIRGFAALLADSLQGTPHVDDVAQIDRAAARAAELTRQLLAFGRRQVLLPRDLSLNELIAGLEKMLARLVPAHVSLTLDCAPDLGVVRADPGQIEQVLTNLVVNARDAMPEGGKLCLRTFNESRAGPEGAREWVVLEVEDDGVGMDEATRKRIFEPFFTTKETDRGTGLGLSSVHGIIVQSGGLIEVDSALREGTVFRILLPRASGAAEPLAPARGTSRVQGKGELVLLAEDDPGLRALVAHSLRQSNHEVLEAPDGRAALILAEGSKRPIDAVVTDIVMPQMNGRELVRHLRDRRPDLPVVFMSGYADELLVRDLPHGPGNAFVRKVFRPDELLVAVREVLEPRAAS
ncbi:MAG: PAS domain S-box protein [Deltaproteobacteria bacterium]|nr:PAS domain S-box protein [Deltaproteobacteria bacterium]